MAVSLPIHQALRSCTISFAASFSFLSFSINRKSLPAIRVARREEAYLNLPFPIDDSVNCTLYDRYSNWNLEAEAAEEQMKMEVRAANIKAEVSVAQAKAKVSGLNAEAWIVKKTAGNFSSREDDVVEDKEFEDALPRLKEEYTGIVVEAGLLSMRRIIEEAEDTHLSYSQKRQISSRFERWELICQQNPELFVILKGCNSGWATEADVAGAVVQFYSDLSSHTHKICRLEYGVAMDIPERICTKATLLLASAIASLTNVTVEFYYTSES